MKHITEKQFKEAQQLILNYHLREEAIKAYKAEIEQHLEEFKNYEIKVSPKFKQVIFSGIKNKSKKIIISASRCLPQDRFDETIGTLIAIRKALRMGFSDLYQYIEDEDEPVFADKKDFVNHCKEQRKKVASQRFEF